MNNVYVHPSAILETPSIGAGTRIWAFSHVMCDASIGSNCNLGEHCFVESGAVIGDNVTIKNGNMIWEGVTLQDGVFVGPNVFFTNDLYPRSPRLPEAGKRYADHRWLARTVVKHGASLGAGAVILAGLTLGEFSTVGAGTIVTHDVPPYALVVGNPGRIRGWVCQCGQPLHFQGDLACCQECERSYIKRGAAVALVAEAAPRLAPIQEPQTEGASGAE